MKRTLIYVLAIFSLLVASQAGAQNRFFINAGYGLAGSFFVRSYDEFNPLQGSKVFYKKHFAGVAQNAAIGLHLKKNWDVKAGINYQHFTRKIQSLDTINYIVVNFDHDIHHRDYMWYSSVSKSIDTRKHFWGFGLGLYYLLPKQEEVEIVKPVYIASVERNQKNSRLNEAGSFAEVFYEYRFQPKVNLGIRGQFYYTVSAGYAESVTLFPFVKISF